MSLLAGLRWLRVFPLVSGIFFIVSPVQAQKEHDLLGKGARAAGMAYAFNAIADDATAMSWNPAGMVQIKKPEIALVNSITATKKERGMEELVYHPTYLFDYLGAVYPIKLKSKDLAFGLSFQNKINYQYKYINVPSAFSKYEGNCNLTVNAVTLSVAYSINRFLSAGFSFSPWFSFGKKEYTYDEYIYPDTSHIYVDNNSVKFTSKNFTAGILLDFEALRFPLRFALKYENKLMIKKDFNEILDMYYAYTYAEDENWKHTFKGVEQYYIPHIITAGISYRFGDYLTVACDLESRLYNGEFSRWNYRWIKKYITGGQMIIIIDSVLAGNAEFDKFYSKLHQYRFGLEYILHPKFALIPIRAGLKNNPTTLYDYSVSNTNPRQVYARSINFGTGCITRRFSLDFAYEQYKYERTDELDVTYEKKFSSFILSAIVYFK